LISSLSPHHTEKERLTFIFNTVTKYPPKVKQKGSQSPLYLLVEASVLRGPLPLSRLRLRGWKREAKDKDKVKAEVKVKSSGSKTHDEAYPPR